MLYVGKQEMCMHGNNLGTGTLRWTHQLLGNVKCKTNKSAPTLMYLHIYCCNLIDRGSTDELKTTETEEN